MNNHINALCSNVNSLRSMVTQYLIQPGIPQTVTPQVIFPQEVYAANSPAWSATVPAYGAAPATVPPLAQYSAPQGTRQGRSRCSVGTREVHMWQWTRWTEQWIRHHITAHNSHRDTTCGGRVGSTSTSVHLGKVLQQFEHVLQLQLQPDKLTHQYNM